MAQLHFAPHYVNRFTHNAEAKMLVSDISDLGVNPFVQLYDDACDTGLAVYNPRTNSTTYWYNVAEVTKEGELTMWVLQPTHESCRKHPAVQCYTMHVYND